MKLINVIKAAFSAAKMAANNTGTITNGEGARP
jgi:hypothetical protein